ncbi:MULTISPECIES: hypothetical protein [unclassified Modestobacter]
MGQRDAGFTAFATDAEDRLLGTALLLTGDRRAAGDLLVRALAGTRHRWHRLPGPAEALAHTRASLVRAALEQPGPADPVVVPAGGEDDLPEADRVWLRALADLAPHPRAVVVLRLHERLDEAAVAALLGCSPTDVAEELTAALGALAPLLTTEPDTPARPEPVAPATSPPAAEPDPDPDAIYRPTGALPAPRPTPEPAPEPVRVPRPAVRPVDDDDPDAIYRRPA